MATTTNIFLLILSMAFTMTIAHPSPSNETRLLKKCTEALGEVGVPLATFCARDLLGHRAAFLATCDRRKTVAVVAKEAYNRAKALEDFGKKIKSYNSLSGKELQDLKSCWRITSNIASSMGSIYNNFGDLNLSSLDVLKGASKQKKAAKQICKFSERKSGVWLELKEKAEESSQAEVVALAFVSHLYADTHL